MKYCTGCKDEKKLERFSKNRSSSDGFDYWCKTCRKALNKKHNSRKHKAKAAYLDALKQHPFESRQDVAIRLFCDEFGVSGLSDLMTRVEWDTDTDCYNWLGGTRAGYANNVIKLPTKPKSVIPVLTHRLTFALSNGYDALPYGDEPKTADMPVLDHMCGNTLCVNPLHLQVISLALNIALGEEVRVAPRFSDLRLIA